MRRAIVVLLVSILIAAAATAPDIVPPPNARLPLNARFVDETGRQTTLGQALAGHPSVVVFADWTCTALCGTTLGQAAMALRSTHLVPGRDYTFLAIGIDPRDSPQQAAAMKAVHLADTPQLSAASRFLSADAATTRQVEDSVGFHAVLLPDEDQFAHPAALLIVAADGRLARVMPSFLLDPAELQAALNRASGSPSLAHQVLLICHALLAGSNSTWVTDALKLAGVATIAALAGALLLLFRHEARR